MKRDPVSNALLEIGVEEIPARFLPPVLSQLKEKTEARLREEGIDFIGIDVWGTPRRLVVFLKNVAARAKDRSQTALGPSLAAAKDTAGQWTEAAKGFARSQKVSVEKLAVQTTPKGDRVAVHHHIKGQKTEVLLREVFPSLIGALDFPKTMVWEPSRFRFARPIRWIVALFNSKVVRFSLAGVRSDRCTTGLLALGNPKLNVAKPDRYKSLLQSRCVLVDGSERSAHIREQLEILAKKVKATPLAEPDHLEEVTYLTEYPVCVLGQFKEEFLALPREVLTVVLRKHQRFFPLEQKGKLSNHFIGVRNGPSEHQEAVRDGYERVINARLADARFFFEHDGKTPIADLVPRLSGIGFHAKLGTMRDKTERVAALTETLGRMIALPEPALDHAKRAAALSKADLLTQMVGELPELQGVAGRFYAGSQEPAPVAEAIEQHYWPLTADGALPHRDEAALVALADKLDTLAANFSVGLAPTGSADPYGLRRAAVGALRILVDRGWNLSMDTLVEAAFRLLPSASESHRRELHAFLLQRFAAWVENQGYRPDEVDSIVSRNGESLAVMVQKLQGIKSVRGKPEFGVLSGAIKRAGNILKQAREKGVMPDGVALSPSDFQDASEKALYDAVLNARPLLEEAIGRRDFTRAFLYLAPLKTPVDAFFEKVMVMVDDPRVRDQRLALLGLVKDLFDSLADFSKLQESSSPPRPA